MHHTVHYQRPEGGRGEGNDSEAEGTIVRQPSDPPDVFKVSVASVKPGHENLPPLILVGDDDETPRRLGDHCKGWVLLWPKSLLRLEAAGSTPTSTQPQQGMNINTPPTQLASGVGLGDSGRGKEEAPLVVDDVAMDEDEDDDGAKQYVKVSKGHVKVVFD